MKKLCYILPEYDEKTATHFAHLYDFIREISKDFDLLVIVERTRVRKDLINLDSSRIKVIRSEFLPLRLIETAYHLKIARFGGYRDFYVHYSFLSAFMASLITKVLGGRVLYWNAGEPWKYKRNILRGTLEKFTYKLITYLVTGTESLKKEYAKQYDLPLEKIKVMPNWVDTRKFQITNHKSQVHELRNQLDIKNDDKIALFVHRLSKRKGAQYLPEIIKSFGEERVVFVIIGDGPERQNLESRIPKGPSPRALGMNHESGGRVRILGWVPNKELPNYYAMADIFIMPSDEEGFPRVLLEAMAAKVPFVASDVGGVKEIIPKGFQEYICAAGDTSCFSAKIKKLLLESEGEINAIKKIESEQANKFSLANSAKIFKEFFK